jgi:5-methylthioribose kinase
MALTVPEDYQPLTPETLPARLGGLAVLTGRLGDPAGWRVEEVGDGNLNLVFIVRSGDAGLVVKQALPHVRLVGDSWPLPLKRAFFEYHALTRQAARDPGRVPEVLYFDEVQALIVMDFLTPHVILRKSLAAGVVHPHLAEQLGLFLARALFRGSDLSMKTVERKADLALFADNVELSDITENLVFTDPYFAAAMNRHTSPQLDARVATLRADRDLKVAAQHLKLAFCANAQTLLHGDLHTGSVMVTDTDTRVIDPEFAVYGPFGFDVGMLLANFLMAYHAQRGHEESPGARDAYRVFILDTVDAIWGVFRDEFARLWRTERTGILYPPSLYEDQGDTLGAEQALADLIHGIWVDCWGFAGVEMHRRILGLAHILEFESIEDPDRRAACERRALATGRQLAVNRARFAGLADIRSLVERIEKEDLA